MASLSSTPFDPVSGDLLPTYREQYVQGQLRADLVQPVEAYLAGSPIQANIVLGRTQALMAAAKAEGQEFTPPPWVQERLRYQPAVSAAGPLRRPVVRLALGLFLLLIGASVVQWLRNEPLLPAPVARAVAQVTSSATQATRHLVQQLTAPSEPAPVVAAPVPVSKPPRPHPAQVRQPAPLAAMPGRVAQVAVARSLPVDSAASTSPASPALAATVGTVRGRITDGQGRPLPGATVLVQGTQQGTSTNAAGDYELTAPVGSTLQFGYGGYADQLQRYAGAGSLNVVLQLNSADKRHRK